MPRRERWAVVLAILEAIDHHRSTYGENARITHVATTANLPYDRLMEYLRELGRAGLITEEHMPRLTEKGAALLRHYRQWNEVLSRFGLG
ncbi:MAG TPA: winged helix-turn-helix domain-containing protein [Thermoplasmata archaeon]|nr:winged helix-turn-helix domain-containing protein [Thermoplasmata archaeon]